MRYGSRVWRRLFLALIFLVWALLFAGFAASLMYLGAFGPRGTSLLLQFVERGMIHYNDFRDVIFWLGWAGSGGVAMLVSSYTLLRAYHYNETNAPYILSDFLEAQTQSDKHAFSALAEAARTSKEDWSQLTPVVRSPWSRFGRLLTKDRPEAQARAAIASIQELEKKSAIASKAADLARERYANAHLLKALNLAVRGADEKAYEELKNTLVSIPDHKEALSEAAAVCRRLGRDQEELQLLQRLAVVAENSNNSLLVASSLRRRAEVHKTRSGTQQLDEARRRLNEAINKLGAYGNNGSQQSMELGRILTLFCEVQILRDRTGHLPNVVQRAMDLMQHVEDHSLPEEAGGESYGRARAVAMQTSFRAQSEADALPEPDDVESE